MKKLHLVVFQRPRNKLCANNLFFKRLVTTKIEKVFSGLGMGMTPVLMI